MQDNTVLIIVTSVLGLAGTVVTSLLTVWREGQKDKLEEKRREWDIQDRKNKADDLAAALKARADQVAQDLAAHASELAGTVKRQNDAVLGKIQENTSLTSDIKKQVENGNGTNGEKHE